MTLGVRFRRFCYLVSQCLVNFFPSIRNSDLEVFCSTWARREHVCAQDEHRTGRYRREMGARRSGLEQGEWDLDFGEPSSRRIGSDLGPRLLAFQNIYYRRTRRLDIPLITDLQLLPPGEVPTPLTDPWVKVEHSIRDGIMRAEPLFLWYKTGKTMQQMSAEEKNSIITEIDVLFGEDRAWYGFEKLEPPVTPEKEDRIASVHVTYRKGVKRKLG